MAADDVMSSDAVKRRINDAWPYDPNDNGVQKASYATAISSLEPLKTSRLAYERPPLANHRAMARALKLEGSPLMGLT
jgi:hypothetical protein